MGPRIREDNGWGWIPASVVTGTGSLREDGDWSPHPRGQRVGMDSRFRLHWGKALRGGTGIGPRIREDNGWGWIPASVVTGTGFLRGDGDGSPHPRGQRVGVDSRFRRHWGQALRGGTGMGPRIREDNGWGWIPASVVTGTGFLRGDGDGSPHPRGQWVGVDSRFRLHGDRLPAGGRGWVPAYARTTGGGGFPLPSSRGQASCGGTGMGPRIREDNGWGWIPASVVTGTGFLRGDGDGSPHPRGQWVGVDSRFRLHWGRLSAGGRGWVPASARTTGGDGFTRGGRFETCPYGAKQVILVEGTGAHKGLPYGKKGH